MIYVLSINGIPAKCFVQGKKEEAREVYDSLAGKGMQAKLDLVQLIK